MDTRRSFETRANGVRAKRGPMINSERAPAAMSAIALTQG
jgi:hypothetical protein